MAVVAVRCFLWRTGASVVEAAASAVDGVIWEEQRWIPPKTVTSDVKLICECGWGRVGCGACGECSARDSGVL